MFNRFVFDPAKTFEQFAKKMNDLSSDFDKGFSVEFGGFAPRVDISEDEKNMYLHVELAGVRKEDVKVTINDDNLLLIKGEKKKINTEDDKKDQTFLRAERLYGEFTRSFTLPHNVKKDSIAAKYENGVLEITLEKIEPEKPKEVNVEIS
jgi:HSP20 family protein